MIDLIFSKDFFGGVTGGLGILIGVGIPVVTSLLVKDYIINFVAGIKIKLNTNFQYINSFEFDGRKNCRVFNIHMSYVEIQDMDADQLISIYNKDFVKTQIWRNIERIPKKSRN